MTVMIVLLISKFDFAKLHAKCKNRPDQVDNKGSTKYIREKADQ